MNCEKIIQSNCYYQILGLETNCTDLQLKKAFKKKAILVHPDKNASPKATEAFKKVNAANNCLSDPRQR